MSDSSIRQPETDHEKASRLFKSGQLAAAIETQRAAVEQTPDRPEARLFLFELLAFSGDLEGATAALSAVRYDDMQRDFAVAQYGQLLDAERTRREVFAGNEDPKFLLDVPAHVEKRLEASKALAAQDIEALTTLLDEAHALASEISGSSNDRPFSNLRDCDDLLGTVLEVMHPQGGYYWVPLEQVQSLDVKHPRFPRDLLWLEATLDVVDGPSGPVFLPSLYPSTYQAQDEVLRLGQNTDWRQFGDEGPVLGVGLKLMLADDDALPLPQLGRLTIG